MIRSLITTLIAIGLTFVPTLSREMKLAAEIK